LKTQITEILFKYWGYSSFRDLQEEVILSVLKGNDTFVMMPTGGGKSLCYQIPGMAKEGICLVISPLISLMKDQVDRLNKQNIKAYYLHAGMHYREINFVIDECLENPQVKFLYVSPERLKSRSFIDNISGANINLIAVDEAHCISQWGYDFRPAYLEIYSIREKFPNVPIVALTASATSKVVLDIQEKLKINKDNVVIGSFDRRNLVYNVFYAEDKLKIVNSFVNKYQGAGIIYTRSRKNTRLISDFLNRNNIKADYYHAGLSFKDREARQNNWLKNNFKIMVATNAFGMGIDKHDVRFVIHYDIPPSIEEYYQEAGRAGRDNKEAKAIMFYNKSDIQDAYTLFEYSYPAIDKIKAIYNALGNYYGVAIGAGENISFDFDLMKFANNYNFNLLTVFSSLRFLEKENYVLFNENYLGVSKVSIFVSRDELYTIQLQNPKLDPLIKFMLRNYPGILGNYIYINENEIAYKTRLNKEKIIYNLKLLEKMNVLVYDMAKTMNQMIFVQNRIDSRYLLLSDENYKNRKQVAEEKLDAMIEYVKNNNKCRNKFIIRYFIDNSFSKRCGKCDICLKRNDMEVSEYDFDAVIENIKPFLQNEFRTMDELLFIVKNVDEDKMLKVLRWLIDRNKIIQEGLKFKWK